ncbi:hybrid sensor histidine kinase/response regulator [Halosimplex pelagicum]|uniref:histidine kinase n=1 Tax=Halosimplex pelagicum TaxID=869886 RepID=A0A7D5PEF7_9EURY|nr:response regulator [Halosimplex pelagicum]QLH84638.1 response regulator [Halosimplex pelagicum]
MQPSTSISGTIRVLHVDDDPDLADLVATYLEREDERLRVETVTTVADGVARLDESDIDCVVSDYDMPGRNGLEFLEAVRADRPDLPFILFTGKGSEEIASDAISAGVSDYLQKGTGTEQYTLLANRVINAVERARAEQAEQRHLRAIETAQEGISILDSDGEFIYVNEAYAALYGYDRAELLGEHWSLLYPDRDTEEIREAILPSVRADGFWRGETTGLRADGTTFVEDHRLATTDHGELVCTVLDTTDHRRHRQAIADLHSTARAFIQAETAEEVAEIAVGAVRDILDMPANGFHRYDEADDSLVPVAWTDRTEELIGEPPTFEPGEGIAWNAFASGEPLVYDDIATNDDRYNPDTPIRSQLALPLDDRGVHLMGSPEPAAFDETEVSLAKTVAAHATAALERVEREQELARQNERLATFTDIVSHDLRNPLNVATGRLELARADCDCPHLAAVDRALTRTETLLDDLHAFARAGTATLDPEPVDLTTLSRACWGHVETGRATLVTDAQQVITADRSRVQELLENLFGNAVEHGGDGVTITVGDLEDGFYVADDGPGIADANKDAVFDHGYSTTEDGTGFGLSIVREIADVHGWDLRVTDSDAGGARFEVRDVELSGP